MSALAAGVPERGRLTLAETFSDSKVMSARQLRKILRRPMYVVYLFVQPVIFVLLFRYVFGGAINTGTSQLRQLPDAGDHRHDRDLRLADDWTGPDRGHGGRGRRPVPVAADRPLGGADRADGRRPR